MRVRCSSGVELRSYTGALYMGGGGATDVYFPNISCDAAVLAELRLDERLQDGGNAYLQAALCYTTPEGGGLGVVGPGRGGGGLGGGEV